MTDDNKTLSVLHQNLWPGMLPLNDRSTREESVDELVRLIGFVEATPCTDGRRQVGARLKTGG
jgi:hypothetical protein